MGKGALRLCSSQSPSPTLSTADSISLSFWQALGDERSGVWGLRCGNGISAPQGCRWIFLGIVFISVSPSDVLRVRETWVEHEGPCALGCQMYHSAQSSLSHSLVKSPSLATPFLCFLPCGLSQGSGETSFPFVEHKELKCHGSSPWDTRNGCSFLVQLRC